MTYSGWRDSWWHTSALTGAPQIDGSSLFINPKVGNSQTLTYARLKALELDTQWVSLTFPDAPEIWLGELLRFIHTFLDDMSNNVYRYHGFKNPTVGVAHDEQRDHDY